MKIETLRDRIEKAKAKIEKKSGTIVKKNRQIEKKYDALRKLGVEDPGEHYKGEFNEPFNSDIYWTYDEVEELTFDIGRLQKEIVEIEKTLAKYEAQLTGEIAKEEILLNEIPEIFNSLRDELVAEWDRWDLVRREDLKKQYRELGYKVFFERNTRAGYEFMYKTEEQIHATNVQDAKLLILDLYYRVKGITGEVTDWDGIETEIGTHGFTVLNGIVIGKEGRAKVESIYAGGYNIQRLHVRVLVHSI
mgnify:CR=1 FL=1